MVELNCKFDIIKTLNSDFEPLAVPAIESYAKRPNTQHNFSNYLPFYRCIAENLTVISRGEVIDCISGDHIENLTNSDVNWLTIRNSHVEYLPIGMRKLFRKITFLVISGIGLQELTERDLYEYPKLKFIWAPNNELVSLEPDLFSKHKVICVMDFSNNKLKYMDKSTLIKPMTNYANFQNNECLKGENDSSTNYPFESMFHTTCLFQYEIYCEYKLIDKRSYEAKILNGTDFEGIKKSKIRYNPNKTMKKKLKFLNQGTKKLEAKFLNFTQIPKIVCEEFINLEELDITGGLIFKISKDELQNFQRLKVLKMPNNQIRILTSDTFLYNRNLETIDLSNNKIDSIGLATFTGLRNLQTLLLHDEWCISGSIIKNHSKIENFMRKINEKCGLDDVITCKFSISNFRYIGSAYSCNIISRTLVESQQPSKFNEPYRKDNFSKLTSLEKYNGVYGKHLDGKSNLDVEVLSIQHGNSRFLKQFLSSYVPNLKTIRIIHSNLLYLFEDTFNGLRNLTVVDMSHNKLTEIPKEIFAQNTNLIFVDFSYNNIKRLPLDVFSDLIHIKVIRLLNNPCIDSNDKDIQFSLLPSVSNKCDLREIELVCNTDKKLVTFCTVISIDQNSDLLPIVKVHNIINFNAIKDFTIDYAAIEYLPTNLSSFFPNVKVYSAYGIVTKIFKQNFENLVHLIKVDLTGNRIETIEEDVFDDNEKLREIYLGYNRIKTIPTNTLMHLRNIYYLELKDNVCEDTNLRRIKLEKSERPTFSVTNICGAKLPNAYEKVIQVY